MQTFPRPTVPSFHVTLLPKQGRELNTAANMMPSPPQSPSSSLTAAHARDEAIATTMLDVVLRNAANYASPQKKFNGYAPEVVLRSVRSLVDYERCAPLIETMRAAVRSYAEEFVRTLTLPVPPPPLQPQRPSTDDRGPHCGERNDEEKGSVQNAEAEGNEEAETAEETTSERVLHAVRTLALLATYWERLQLAIAELAAVWVYADQWCMAQAGGGLPRSLQAMATQEMCGVLNTAPHICEVALVGYLAILEEELRADTKALFASTTSTSCSSSHVPRATPVGLRHVESLHSPLVTVPASSATKEASLAVLASPTSLSALDGPLRQRLLRIFTQLTLATKFYHPQVEQGVVEVVKRHYEAVSHRLWAEDVPAEVYFKFCEGALQRIVTVYEPFLAPSTTPLLEEAVNSAAIDVVGREVLVRSFAELMENVDYGTLRLAWRLLSAAAHVRSAPIVATLFRDYILDGGQRIMEELVPGSAKVTPAAATVPLRHRAFLAVRHLLGLLEQGNRTVDCFKECQKEFRVALHEDFQTILEAYPQAFSEQLAGYQDAIMRELELGRVPLGSISITKVTNEGGSAAAADAPQQSEGTRTFDHGAAEEREDAEDKCGQGEEEEESPRNRPRNETAAAAAAAAAIMPSTSPTDASKEKGEYRGNEDAISAEETKGTALPGMAALRLAAPLPAEVTDAGVVLRQIAHVYSYHPKKDLFESAYWRDLARRCLHPHRKLNTSAENAFIFFLRDICGLSFTSKFEGMLADQATATELTSQYKTWAQERERARVGSLEAGHKMRQRGAERDASEEETAQGRWISQPARSELDVHLSILTQSYWPKYPPLPRTFYVPPAMQAIVRRVEEFYTSRFPHRALHWQHPLSNVVLLTRLSPQSAALALTGTYAQCIFLMRLDALQEKGIPSITAQSLCEAVGMDVTHPDVLLSLQGLCHNRFRLVLRSSASATSVPLVERRHPSTDLENEEEDRPAKDHGNTPPSSPLETSTDAASDIIAPTDVLQLNLHFTSATSKVRIPLPTRLRAAATPGGEGAARSGRNADSGGHLLEVAIISCLKADRVVSHADLVSAVGTRLPFPVTTAALKKTLDKLIERGFVVRGSGNTYVYSV